MTYVYYPAIAREQRTRQGPLGSGKTKDLDHSAI
jgi:hypothetical protein